MRKIVLTIMMVCMLAVPTFATTTADIEAKLAIAQKEIDQEISASKEELLDKTYPVGSVYTTMEDLSEKDLGKMLGGKWEQIKGKDNQGAFLWAADGSEDTDEYGGKSQYKFSALLGGLNAREGYITYIPGHVPPYMRNHQNYAMKGIEEDEPISENELNYDGSVSSDEIEIMPNYLVVKMFRRTQ